VLQRTVPNLRQALILRRARDRLLRQAQDSVLVLLIGAVLLAATSSAGSATPTSTGPGTTPTTSHPDTVPETSAPVPQSSPGQLLRSERISLEQGLSQGIVFGMRLSSTKTRRAERSPLTGLFSGTSSYHASERYQRVKG
jgi:hypothetical protein